MIRALATILCIAVLALSGPAIVSAGPEESARLLQQDR